MNLNQPPQWPLFFHFAKALPTSFPASQLPDRLYLRFRTASRVLVGMVDAIPASTGRQSGETACRDRYRFLLTAELAATVPAASRIPNTRAPAYTDLPDNWTTTSAICRSWSGTKKGS